MLVRRALILIGFIFATGAAFAQIVQDDASLKAAHVTSQQLQALSIRTTCAQDCADWRNGQ